MSNGCPACGSAEVRWADYLGNVMWAQCRACGSEYSLPEDEDEDVDDSIAEDLYDRRPLY